ncbi:transposase family protein [Arthrobacter sp. UYEF21]
MIVHCGPTLAGEFIRTLTATNVFTGWTENIAVRNGAHKWVLEAMDEVVDRLPFPLVGLDTDNAEFINHALINWAGDKNIYFTRSRPYKSNDNAHVEQKNGDVVRRHAFHYRNDTAAALDL